MSASSMPLLTATSNRQGVFEGFNVNGERYQLDNGGHGWHVTVFPGQDPVNVYWVSGSRFYAAKIHLITEPCAEIRLEKFDEISFVPHTEKNAVLKAIAEWDKA